MNRRTFLAAVSAAPLAGCVNSAGTPTPVVPDGVHRLVALESSDDAPAEGVRIDASVTEPFVTDEHPARVGVTTTNEGRKRDVSISPGQCCLFNRNGGASEPEGAWLHRTEKSGRVDRDGDRWTRDRSADEGRAYFMYGCLPKTFDAGEALTNEYHVWDDYRVEGYLSPGTYRFEEPVTVTEPGGDLDDESDVLAEFDWGFDLRVERP